MFLHPPGGFLPSGSVSELSAGYVGLGAFQYGLVGLLTTI